MAVNSINEPKRIMIVIGTLAVGGGAEKVAATIGTELTKRGHEVHLVTFYEAKQKFSFVGTYHSLSEAPQNRFIKLLLIPKHIWFLRQYTRNNNIDIAISFLEEANFQLLLTKLLFKPKLPVIVSVRNNILTREWPFKLMTRLLYPYAQKVVTVTKAIEETLKSNYGLCNTLTIYNPLDLDQVKKKMKEVLPEQYQSIFFNRVVYVSIGRLTHQKGQWHSIRAFTKVVGVLPNAHLLIIGEGELESRLKQLAKECGLDGKFTLISNQDNVYNFLNAADAFVFSSLWEGMPNTMLEALSVGTTIVSPDCVSGPREIIAPGSTTSEILIYPYQTEVGILTTPFADGEEWRGVKEVPLTLAELQLADSMIKVVKEREVGSKDTALFLAPFQLNNVSKQWEGLLA
jgi:glycosyltransferase involved in cell wall biosynthesis